MSVFLYEDIITLPACQFPKSCDYIAIDKGCSLTKACIGKRNGESVKFTCRTYRNSDLDSVLDWLAASDSIQSSTGVKVTGVGGDIIRQSVSERLGCRVDFADEFRAQKSGAEMLLNHGKDEEMFYPDPPLLYKSKMKTNSDVWNQVADQVADTTSSLPTLFVYIGSATGMSWVGGEEQKIFAGGSFLGGKSFMGLCNLVLDTRDFKEIDELALKGDRSKVDMLGSDVFKDVKDPSYAAFPEDMSIFHLGKLADGLVSNAQLSRADKAASLVGFFGEIFRTFIQGMVTGRKCSRIVIGGNLIRSEYFRADCLSGHEATSIFHGGKPLKFLRNGHSAAFGALTEEPMPK